MYITVSSVSACDTGDEIDDHLSTRDVCDTDTSKGKLDNHNYINFCLKEPYYGMKIFSTSSELIEYPSQKFSTHYLSNIAG